MNHIRTPRLSPERRERPEVGRRRPGLDSPTRLTTLEPQRESAGRRLELGAGALHRCCQQTLPA